MAAVPDHTKTWQPDFGIAGGAAAANLLSIKNSFIGFPILPYEVAGSSDSVTAGMDAVDRWLTSGNVVRVAVSGAHSWIVLTSPMGFQVCWDYIGSVANTAHFYVSPAGLFTGGSTTARPTATDEFFGDYLGDNQIAFHGEAPEDVDTIHVEHSDDGMFTYVFMFGDFGGLNHRGIWAIGVPDNLSALWTPNPCVFYIEAAADNPSTMCGTSGSGARAMVGHNSPVGGSFRALAAFEFHHDGGDSREMFINAPAATNDISGETWMDGPIKLVCRDEPEMFGPVGVLPDLYAASDSGEDDEILQDTTRLWKRCGAFVLPWDGS